MERYEMAETLSRKAGVTLEEAREALAENEWDMLDAMIALERKNRPAQAEPVTVSGGQENAGYTYSTPQLPQPVKSAPEKDPVLTNGFAELWGYIKKFILLLVNTMFTVTRKGRVLMSFPVIWLVVLLLCCFWVTVPAMVIGLFFGCKYRFEGKGTASDAVNKAMESLEDVVDGVKDKAGESAGKAVSSIGDAMEDIKDSFTKN